MNSPITRKEALELIRMTYGKHGIADIAVTQARELEFYLLQFETGCTDPVGTSSETDNDSFQKRDEGDAVSDQPRPKSPVKKGRPRKSQVLVDEITDTL